MKDINLSVLRRLKYKKHQSGLLIFREKSMFFSF